MMALDQSGLRPFHFFDLPPELRNMVYDNLKEFRYDETWVNSASVAIQRLPLHLRFVSRQFREEAEDRIERSITLSISCWSCPWKIGGTMPECPETVKKQASRVSALVVKVPISCCVSTAKKCTGHQCGAGIAVMRTRSWIRDIVRQLKNLKSVKVELYIRWPRKASKCWPALHHGQIFADSIREFPDIPHLDSVAAYGCDRMFPALELSPRGLWAQWSKDGGWQAPAAGKIPPSIWKDRPAGEKEDESNDDDEDDDDSSPEETN